MEQNCKYHPLKPAAWHCPNCKVHFCSGCVRQDSDNYFPKCTLCRRSLRSHSVSDRIPPFWQKLNQLLMLPLKSGPLGLIALFALVISILPFSEIGLVLLLLCLMPWTEFCFDTMEQLAAGDEYQIKASKYLSFKHAQFFFKILLSIALVLAALAKINETMPGLSYLLGASIILGMPAGFIILMMEKSLFAMFNPAKVAYIVKTFGRAYAMLYAGGLVCTYLAYTLATQVAAGELNWLEEFLLAAFTLYLSVVVFIMAGYLVYQYHFELNFTINRQSLHRIEDGEPLDSLAEVNILIQEGRYEDAQKLLLARIDADPSDYKANQKLILLYAVQQKSAMMQQVADQYFQTMVKRGKHRQAAEFYQAMLERGIDYQSRDSVAVFTMAEALNNRQDYLAGMQLIDGLLANNERPQAWERIYLLKARMLNEQAKEPVKAKEYLQYVINRSIDQEMMSQADAYLKLIEN